MIYDLKQYLNMQLSHMIEKQQGYLTLDLYNNQGQFVVKSNDPVLTTFCTQSVYRKNPDIESVSIHDLLNESVRMIQKNHVSTGHGRLLFNYHYSKGNGKLKIYNQPSYLYNFFVKG